MLQSWGALRRPIWMFDPHNLRGVYANAAALELWGAKTLEELLARDFSNLSPAAKARTDRLAAATAAGGVVDERWTFYPKGEPVTVQATISMVRLGDGRAVLLFEASPAEVEAGERRAVEALRHTSTLITVFDGEGRPVFCNPAAFAAYGATELPFNARFRDPDAGEALFQRVRRGETVAEVMEAVTPDGIRWRHFDVRPTTDPVTGLTGVLLNETDVTDRVEAEQAKAAAEQKAAMVEARERFLTEMSHELRTPLNAVLGFSQLLQTAGLSPVQTDQAQRIHDAGRRLLAVVNEMIQLSELDAWTGEAPAAAAQAPGPAATTAPAPTAEIGNDPDRPLRVLCVDDNDSNRTLIAAVLTSQGIDCVTANDGREGLEAAMAGGFDAILMDIQMPVMDGVAATRAIRSLCGPVGDVPIIAVTANTLVEQLVQYERAGMTAVVSKPIDVMELMEALAAAIDGAAHEDGRGTSPPPAPARFG